MQVEQQVQVAMQHAAHAVSASVAHQVLVAPVIDFLTP